MSNTQPIDPKQTDEAWMKLESKLMNEEKSPIWDTWADIESNHSKESIVKSANVVTSIEGKTETEGLRTEPKMKKKRSRLMTSGRKKWVTLAAAGLVFITVTVTPVGNKALAAILGQFRMQDVTTVDQNEIRNMFNQTMGGELSENVNKFGAFSNSTGKLSGEFTGEEATKRLNYKLPNLSEKEMKSVYIQPSSQLTFNLHVDQINKAMKLLGASKLLPESVDGKAIKLEIPETISYSLSSDDEHWAGLYQQNVPVISVDSSIDVKDALEAVIEFPLLPNNLKESLQKSSVLNGDIPMPVLVRDNSEQWMVKGTKVIAEIDEHAQSFYATWIKDGSLYRLQGGNMITTKDEFKDKLGELIGE